ncbi:MAG: hypothetical protein C0507_00220 [Cyanobacteria bacterium PR.3.49]|nr:hypothetical protein [Cyanobacteria bacterium PR.3.49]
MRRSRLNSLVALAAFAAAVSCSTVFARTIEDSAEMLYKSGHREDAIRTITRGIKLAPQHGHLYTIRGRYYLRTERYELAVADFEKAMAVSAHEKQDWIYRMKAEANVNLHRFDAAIADMKKAIALKKNDEYYKMLGELYYQQKRYDEAIDIFSKGIAVNPKSYWLYRIRGDVYFHQKKYQKAVDDYSAVIKIVPNDLTGYGSRAKAYERMGLHALADKDLARTKKDNGLMGDFLK